MYFKLISTGKTPVGERIRFKYQLLKIPELLFVCLLHLGHVSVFIFDFIYGSAMIIAMPHHVLN